MKVEEEDAPPRERRTGIIDTEREGDRELRDVRIVDLDEKRERRGPRNFSSPIKSARRLLDQYSPVTVRYCDDTVKYYTRALRGAHDREELRPRRLALPF